MELPIFGFCEGWLYLYSTKESAEIDIEPIDVENNEWKLFDSKGKQLELRINSKHSRIPFCSREWVEVEEPAPPNPENKDEFKQLLIAGIQKLPNKEKSRLGFADSEKSLCDMQVDQLSLLAQKAFLQH